TLAEPAGQRPVGGGVAAVEYAGGSQKKSAAAQTGQLLARWALCQPGQQSGVVGQGAVDSAASGGEQNQIGIFGQAQVAIDLDLRKAQINRLPVQADTPQLEQPLLGQPVGQLKGVHGYAQAGAHGLRADVEGNFQHDVFRLYERLAI